MILEQVSLRINSCFLPSFLFQEHFAELFGQDAAAESRRSQESFKKWLLAGMTLVTGVVVGSLIAQKRLWGTSWSLKTRPPPPRAKVFSRDSSCTCVFHRTAGVKPEGASCLVGTAETFVSPLLFFSSVSHKNPQQGVGFCSKTGKKMEKGGRFHLIWPRWRMCADSKTKSTLFSPSLRPVASTVSSFSIFPFCTYVSMYMYLLVFNNFFFLLFTLQTKNKTKQQKPHLTWTCLTASAVLCLGSSFALYCMCHMESENSTWPWSSLPPTLQSPTSPTHTACNIVT